MKNLLIPIDGSEFSTRAMEYGKNLAKSLNVGIVLLHIKDVRLPIHYYESGNVEEMKDSVQKIMHKADEESSKIIEKAEGYFSDMKDKIEVVVLNGDPTHKIVEYVNNNDVELTIMGSHGMGSGFQSLVLGSVANKVLHHVKKPVLIIK